jgi:hypothetical protein
VTAPDPGSEPTAAAGDQEPGEANQATGGELDDVLVLAVSDDEQAGALSTDPAELSQTLSDLQTELAGTARTGVPAVDAALDRLADIDPTDLAGSAEILADVLRRLEGAMEEDPEA